MKKISLLVLSLLIATLSSTVYATESKDQRDSSNKEKNILKKLWYDDQMLNILLDTRNDFQSVINNNGTIDNMSFVGQTYKVWFVGSICPFIHYRVRQRLNKPLAPLREGYSAATDQAWVSFDIGPHWTITAGKQSVQFGTYEYNYNPADIYVPTMAFNDLDAYKTGVNFAYKFMNQIIDLQFINSDSPQFSSQKFKNKALAMNVLWEGSLFNNLIGTRWGYGLFQHDKNKFYNWITLGTQLNLHKFTAELDYYAGDRTMDYSSVVNNKNFQNQYVYDNSVTLNLKWDFGKWKPFIKGIFNTRHDKQFSNNVYDNWGIHAVVEYYPFKSKLLKDLRFHAMYAYNVTNFRNQFKDLADQGQHTILIGTRWLFKVK